MQRIVRIEGCFINDENAQLTIRNERYIDREEVFYLHTKEQYIALAYRLLDWQEIGKYSPVIISVYTEDTETGEVEFYSFTFSDETIFRHI